VDPRQLAALGLLGGSIGGSALGGHVGQSVARPDREREKQSALADAYSAGEKAALDRFKVAFLGAVAPLIGSIAGPALARGALGRVAPMAAKAIGSGMKGQLFDAAASTVGGMAGQKLTGPVG